MPRESTPGCVQVEILVEDECALVEVAQGGGAILMGFLSAWGTVGSRCVVPIALAAFVDRVTVKELLWQSERPSSFSKARSLSLAVRNRT